MTSDENVFMIVRWKEQRRFVTIKVSDDISAIEKAIIECYQVQKQHTFSEYQIQYYDTDHQIFIDLYPETLHLFRQLLHKLVSSNAPSKITKDWSLRIVPKVLEPMCDTLHELATDDTYSYQQENDPLDSRQTEDASSLTHHLTNDSHPVFLPCRSRMGSPVNFSEARAQKDEEDQSTTMTSSEHPYGLHFDSDLSEYQRLQFESEMRRKKSLKSAVGGVLLRAAHQLNVASSDDITYPTVYFKIPNEKIHSDEFLYIYVLTEADKLGVHYLHASKGIYDSRAKPDGNSSIIRNTEMIVNPYIITLSQDDVRDGKYILHVKVCNIRNVSTLQYESLREFPPLNHHIGANDETLLTTKTTNGLDFSNKKYHLGCILVHQGQAYDRCISSLTSAIRKRNDTDRAVDEDNESREQKKQRK